MNKTVYVGLTIGVILAVLVAASTIATEEVSALKAIDKAKKIIDKIRSGGEPTSEEIGNEFGDGGGCGRRCG